MTFITNLRIPVKIALAFAIVCVVILATGAVNIVAFSNLHKAVDDLETVADFDAALEEFSDVSRRQQQALLRFMLTGEREELETYNRLDGIYGDKVRRIWEVAPPDVPRDALETLLRADQDLHDQVYEVQIGLMRRGETVPNARALELTALPARLHKESDVAFATLNDWQTQALEAAEASQTQANAIMEKATYASVAVSVILAVALGLGLTRMIARPISGMNAFMGRLSDGDLSDANIPGQGRRDEIGAMAGAVAVFRDGLIRAHDLAEQQKAEYAQREHQQKELRRLVQSFEGTVISVLDGLSNADHLLRDTAERMTVGAHATLEKSAAASGAASGASEDVNTVASSAEELSASIQEIARRVAEATSVASRAVVEAETSSQEIAQLNDCVARIGEVVRMISDIASQTNLLALNATIEAARAGDAGKGFAVVANEVKTLATQTARATEDVSKQIAAIQSATRNAVSAIEKVTGIIRNIDEISSGIAAAVEQQGAATSEIARGAEHTATATEHVVGVMEELRIAANEAGEVASDVAQASEKISQQAATLKVEVRDFLASVEASEQGDGATLVTVGDEHGFGVAKIDEDHRALMALTNELYGAIKNGSEGALLDKCFGHLKTYATEHFAGEDAFMDRSNYPDRAQHQRHHAQFVQRLDNLYGAYREGDHGAGMDLLAFLGSWWRMHMDGDDAALAKYVRAGAAGNKARAA